MSGERAVVVAGAARTEFGRTELPGRAHAALADAGVRIGMPLRLGAGLGVPRAAVVDS